jgi:hypothetical protein
MLEPVFADVVDGHAEVRQIFRISRQGNIAGCMVLDGTLLRNDQVRVKRGAETLAETRCAGLRRFQDDVREVQSGYECGIFLENFDDIKEGDILEFYLASARTKPAGGSRAVAGYLLLGRGLGASHVAPSGSAILYGTSLATYCCARYAIHAWTR